jgi:hypothetical protein
MMPSDLIRRSFGRLEANCNSLVLGLLAAYVTDEGIWFPDARAANPNPSPSTETFAAIARYYDENFERFLDTSRY